MPLPVINARCGNPAAEKLCIIKYYIIVSYIHPVYIRHICPARLVFHSKFRLILILDSLDWGYPGPSPLGGLHVHRSLCPSLPGDPQLGSLSLTVGCALIFCIPKPKRRKDVEYQIISEKNTKRNFCVWGLQRAFG